MESRVVKQFSMEYVLTATYKHMLKSVDISIKKTLNRIAEFEGNQEKSQEIFVTLTKLHKIKSDIDSLIK